MSRRAQLDWLLEEFAEGTPGVVHGVVVSADGLRMAASARVGVTLGDQLAAAASGLVSLARGTSHLLAAGPVTQTILEMTGGYLFVTAIGHGAALAVFADRSCDMGLVGYEMTLLATRAGHALTPALRPAAGGG
jgi:predicted regulator of Ras-like GTPase activity (Roadblock/LC7/MglB family)